MRKGGPNNHFQNPNFTLLWKGMPEIPERKSLRQEDPCKLETSMGYKESSRLAYTV